MPTIEMSTRRSAAASRGICRPVAGSMSSARGSRYPTPVVCSRAAAILGSDEYADQVRERERMYLDAGIHSVPAVIINDRHLISGGQPAHVFAQALRQIAAGE